MSKGSSKSGPKSWTKAKGRDSTYHGIVHNPNIRSRPRSGFSEKVLPDCFSTGHLSLKPAHSGRAEDNG